MWWVWGTICGCCSSLGPRVACLQCPGDEQVHLPLLRKGLIKWPWQWTSVNACEVTHPREKNLPVFLTSSFGVLFLLNHLPSWLCVWLPASFLAYLLVEIYLSQMVLAGQRLWINRQEFCKLIFKPLLARNQPWWEYLQHRNWQTLQMKPHLLPPHQYSIAAMALLISVHRSTS